MRQEAFENLHERIDEEVRNDLYSALLEIDESHEFDFMDWLNKKDGFRMNELIDEFLSVDKRASDAVDKYIQLKAEAEFGRLPEPEDLGLTVKPSSHQLPHTSEPPKAQVWGVYLSSLKSKSIVQDTPRKS